MSEQNTGPFQISVESPEAWQRVIKVLVPRAEYDRQYQQRLTAAARDHKRPGFRKGKTPRSMVEKEYGGRLRIDTFEGLVPQAYRAAVIEHRMYPITEPQLENLVFEDGQDLTFDLKVEVRPEVEATDYEGLPLRERQVEITSAEVDEFLDRLREHQAVFEAVDRPAADGDQLVLDLVPRGDDGEPQEDRRMSAQHLQLGGENNLPAFNEALQGATAGQDLEISVSYPEDYPSEALRGRTVGFACHVVKVEQKVTPEVDDAFASRLQEGQTLLELRGRIRESLEAEAKKRVAQDLDAQVVERLIERNEVPVPPSMVEAWLQSAVQELQQRAAQAGREVTDADVAEYREAARPEAERQLKAIFLFEAIRRQEQIKVTDEDVDARVVEVADEHGFDRDKYREYVEKGDEKDRILHDLLERRTYDFLLSRAVVTPAEDEG